MFAPLELRGQEDPAKVYVCCKDTGQDYVVQIDSIYSFVQIDGYLSVDGASFETADDETIDLVNNLWDTSDKCYGQDLTCHLEGRPLREGPPYDPPLAIGELPYELIPHVVTRKDFMTGLRDEPPQLDIRTTCRVRKRNDVRVHTCVQ